MLYRLKRSNQRWRKYANMLVQENRWRAQRYGLDEGLVDFGKGGTSAHRQVQVYEEALEEGAEKPEALKAVVDFLIEETLAGDRLIGVGAG